MQCTKMKTDTETGYYSKITEANHFFPPILVITTHEVDFSDY